MADVKWIKITTDMSENRKVKHLRRLPDGDSMALIWVMLLTMAGRCNDSGMVYLTKNIPYTADMLADELGFDESVMSRALETFERLDMIAFDEDGLAIVGWEEHQNTDGMEKIREQTKKRVSNYRNKRKMGTDDEPLDKEPCENATVTQCNATSNATVTQCNATDKEIDIENKNIYIPPIIPPKGEMTAFEQAIEDFKAYRKRMKKPMTDRAVELLLQKLQQLAPNDEAAQIAILEQSIVQGWQGVFPLKTEEGAAKYGHNQRGRRYSKPEYEQHEVDFEALGKLLEVDLNIDP